MLDDSPNPTSHHNACEGVGNPLQDVAAIHNICWCDPNQQLSRLLLMVAGVQEGVYTGGTRALGPTPEYWYIAETARRSTRPTLPRSVLCYNEYV